MTDLSWPWTRPRPLEPVAADAARHRWTTAVLYSSTFAWALGFSSWPPTSTREFISHRYDLGNIVQAVWSTAHGRFLENTATDGTQMNRLGSHVDPFLALFAPLWWLWPSPRADHDAAGGGARAGALPDLLARPQAHRRPAGGALPRARDTSLLPAVQWGALDDVHAVTFAIPPPPLLHLVSRRGPCRRGRAVRCSCREHEGGHSARPRRDRRLVRVPAPPLDPRVDAGRPEPRLDRGRVLRRDPALLRRTSVPSTAAWTRWAGRPAASSQRLSTDPVEHLARGDDGRATVRYVAALLLPLLLLPLLEPLLALAALPVLALSLLSDFEPMTVRPIPLRSAPVACLVAAAAIGDAPAPAASGHARVGRGVRGRGDRDVRRAAAYGRERRADEDASAAAVDVMNRAMALVPGDAAVSASNRIGAHLSERRRICSFPVRAQADWVIVDQEDPITEAATQSSYREAVAAILVDPAWIHMFDEGGVHVLRRRADDA